MKRWVYEMKRWSPHQGGSVLNLSTHDLVTVSQDTVKAKFLCGVFSPLTSAEACEKSS